MRIVYKYLRINSFDDFESESSKIKLLIRNIYEYKKIIVLKVPKMIYQYYLDIKGEQEQMGIFDHPQVEAFFEDIVKKYEEKAFIVFKPEAPENEMVKEREL